MAKIAIHNIWERGIGRKEAVEKVGADIGFEEGEKHEK